jgi:hypothetical protein
MPPLIGHHKLFLRFLNAPKTSAPQVRAVMTITVSRVHRNCAPPPNKPLPRLQGSSAGCKMSSSQLPQSLVTIPSAANNAHGVSLLLQRPCSEVVSKVASLVKPQDATKTLQEVPTNWIQRQSFPGLPKVYCPSSLTPINGRNWDHSPARLAQGGLRVEHSSVCISCVVCYHL